MTIIDSFSGWASAETFRFAAGLVSSILVTGTTGTAAGRSAPARSILLFLVLSDAESVRCRPKVLFLTTGSDNGVDTVSFFSLFLEEVVADVDFAAVGLLAVVLAPDRIVAPDVGCDNEARDSDEMDKVTRREVVKLGEGVTTARDNKETGLLAALLLLIVLRVVRRVGGGEGAS